jgi:predicted SnoaL-like aldol condensation-catalyzing enzyme
MNLCKADRNVVQDLLEKIISRNSIAKKVQVTEYGRHCPSLRNSDGTEGCPTYFPMYFV